MYISKFEVIPEVRYSIMAIFEKAYIRSSFSLASIGKTFSLSHLSSGRSSAKERKKVIAECVWASLKPGIIRFPLRLISLSHLILLS